jgi:bloom syndrome protein
MLAWWQSIDVDQIVMEHYQATCTPQPAISKFPPITPTVDQNSFITPEEISVPPELCSNCSHGFKVWALYMHCSFALFYSVLILICLTPKSLQLGLCPEAAKHLQEMKDMLIAVSNDLLDNAAELSQAQIDKLRQDRLRFFSLFFSHDIILPFDAWVFLVQWSHKR